MSWDLENDNVKTEFTKFPAGVSRIRIVDEEPHMRWTHWMNNIRHSVNCPGKGCPICEIRKFQKANKEDYTYPMSKRFSIQVLNRETKKLEVCEQGVTFFQDLKDVKNDIEKAGHSLLDVDIKVRRRGLTKDDTTYRLDPDEVYELTPDEIELISDKLDLNQYFKPHTPEQITRVLNGEDWKDVMYEKKDEDIEIS